MATPPVRAPVADQRRVSTAPGSFDELLQAAQAGHGWAFARLYEELKRPVVTFVRLGGAREPDDLTSEVFLQVFRDLDAFDGDAAGFRAWVFTIARRRLVDEHRRRARRVREVSLPQGLDPVGGDAEAEAVARAGSAAALDLLGQLTGEQREVVLLRIVADLSLEQTAIATGRSVNAVKQLQHRAVDALRRAAGVRP